MKKIEYETNKWVASVLCANVPEILDARARLDEDFAVADIDMSAKTKSELGYSYFPVEVKRIMGGFNFKEDGEWRQYFKQDRYATLEFTDTGITSGAPIWLINAEDVHGEKENAKLSKLLKQHACLAFVAGDGIVLFGPKKLKQAIIGYAYWTGTHGTMLGDNKKVGRELKAAIDLSRGFFIPCNTPKDLIMK